MAPRGPVVTLTNGREFRRALKRAELDCADLKDANQRAANLVMGVAASRAPRRTGKLAGSHRAGRAQARATVTVTVPYAGPIHWGWPARNIPPQPWLLDAATSTEPQWLPLYEADLRAIAARFDREG